MIDGVSSPLNPQVEVPTKPQENELHLEKLLAQLPFPDLTPETIQDIHKLYTEIAPLIKDPSDETQPTLEAQTQQIEEQLKVLEQKKIDQANIDISKFIEELKKILDKKSNPIEQQLVEMGETKKPQKVVEAVDTMKAWGLDYVDTTREVVKDGIEFVENVLPSEMFETHGFEHFEEFQNVWNLGLKLIAALDIGSAGIMLICKIKMLEQSRSLLEKIKQDPNFSSLSLEESKKITKWEMNLKLEEENLASEKLKFGLEASYLALVATNTALNSTSGTLPGVAMAASGLSWTLDVFWVVLVGLALKQAQKNTQTVTDWRREFQQYLSARLPKSTIQLANKPEDEALANHIRLDLLLPAETDDKYQESLATLIQGTQDLLTKREAIAHQKLLKLRPHFQDLAPKIEVQQRASFDHAMNTVERILSNPHIVLNFKKDSKMDSKVQEQLLEAKALLEKWGFTKEQHPEIFSSFDTWEKATELAEKRTARHTLFKNFELWKADPEAVQNQFQTWYDAQKSDAQTQDKLLQSYIDHQETLEQTTKNALNQMIQQKHEIEESFLGLKQVRLNIHFNLSLVSLAISATLAIIGLATTPFGGIGIIFLVLSAGSFAVGLGMIGASCYQSYRVKPQTTQLMMKGFQLKLLWANLRLAIQDYTHQAKNKKLKAISQILLDALSDPLHKTDNEKHQKLLVEYEKAKKEFEESQNKVKEWTERAKQLQTELTQATWQDFVQQADLKHSTDEKGFDTLRAFNEAFQACDLELLNPEVKLLLETHLGLDLKAAQAALSKDKNSEAVKKTLQKFFSLDDASLVSFIQQQQAAREIGLIQPLKT